ncbi:GspMb/PilO family protein [Collimonas humicola]|uniref:GspMb/PilO family protein n=1 Tax=Collimonas humicola TaxID=2825886 RepID=UPI001B8C6145|nr:GspMb/PilO family protein [Collimonas humicola]
MSSVSLLQLGCRLRLALMRIGLVHSFIGCALLLGLIGWLWVIPQLRADADAQQVALVRAKSTLAAPPAAAAVPPQSAAESRLQAFYAALAPTADAEQHIKTLFAIADHQHLQLNLTDYKMAANPDGHYRSYQLQFPLSGSYAAIRQFCEQLLREMPFASLDEINFKRDTINSAKLDAKLRITLYLANKPESSQASAAKQEVAR